MYFLFYDVIDDMNNYDYCDIVYIFVIFGNLLYFFIICNINKLSLCWKIWYCKIIFLVF